MTLVILSAAAGIFVSSLVLGYDNREAFDDWIREDGFVEWLTFVALAAAAVLAARTAFTFGDDPALGKARRLWFLLALVAAFGAAEEISWGQRVFGWASPQWFIDHNAQAETNFHNLIVAGIKLNRLVFGKFLAVLVLLYLLVAPVLYRSSLRWWRLFDRSRVPLPQTYHIILWIGSAALVSASKDLSSRVAEMREFAGAVVFLTILMHPCTDGLATIERSSAPRPSPAEEPVGEPSSA